MGHSERKIICGVRPGYIDINFSISDIVQEDLDFQIISVNLCSHDIMPSESCI